MSTPQTHYLQVGDTRTPLTATLVRPDGSAVDLSGTGITVKFKMIAPDGTVKVAETEDNVTITNASQGQVQYHFQSADVDAAGVYYAYFVLVEGTDRETFPVQKGHLRIDIQETS